MTGPRLATTDRYGKRVYRWPPTGELVPSVTTILNKGAKPALVPWAAKVGAEYAVDNILLWENLPREAAIDLIKNTHRRISAEKMDRGSAVHIALEAWINADPDNPPVVHPDLIPFVAAGSQFLDDLVDRVLYTEATIFNMSMKYAGTCDLIVELVDGRVAVCDWKTGGLWPEAAWQLSAYANGETLAVWDEANQEHQLDPMPRIDTALVVQVTEDATYTAKEVPLVPRRWREFIALRTLQKWSDDHKHEVFGQEWSGRKEEAT